jgi:hypothetical protein
MSEHVDLRLVRSERVGEVHVIKGAAVRSRGRDLTATACGCIIAGPPFFGDNVEITCPECRILFGGSPLASAAATPRRGRA